MKLNPPICLDCGVEYIPLRPAVVDPYGKVLEFYPDEHVHMKPYKPPTKERESDNG